MNLSFIIFVLCFTVFGNYVNATLISAPKLPKSETTIMKSPLPIAPVGIVCANPARAALIAEEYFDYYFIHTDFRGYKVYVGEYKGEKMFVAYIGLGGASAGFLMEELIAYDAEIIIRLGSNDFNTTKEDLKSVYVVKECYGLLGMFQDLGYPSDKWGQGTAADARLVRSLMEHAKEFPEIKAWESNGYNVDSFYAFMDPKIAYDRQRLENLIKEYQTQLGNDTRLCRDMETCSVLLISQLRGIRAASVLQAVVKHEQTHEDVGTTGIELVLSTLHSESVKLRRQRGSQWLKQFNVDKKEVRFMRRHLAARKRV